MCALKEWLVGGSSSRKDLLLWWYLKFLSAIIVLYWAPFLITWHEYSSADAIWVSIGTVSSPNCCRFVVGLAFKAATLAPTLLV